jgi:hypothetical protein
VRVRPRFQGAAGKLRPVVQHDRLRQAHRGTQALQHPRNVQAGQRSIDFDRDAFPRVVADDVQRAERTTVGQRVQREIHRPPFAASRRRGQRHAFAAREPLPSPTAHLQTRLPIESVETFVVHRRSVARDQDMQATISEATALRGVRICSSLNLLRFIALL